MLLSLTLCTFLLSVTLNCTDTLQVRANLIAFLVEPQLHICKETLSKYLNFIIALIVQINTCENL